MNTSLILFGKFIIWFSRITNKGNGSTWPGHIALTCNKHFIKDTSSSLKVILIVGTNGKTTTGKMIATILEKNGKTVFQNESGANLLNGIASSLIRNATITGKIKKEYAIFEVDENILPLLLQEITPFAILALDLFRDQLDRYGELDSIAKKWKKSFQNLGKNTTLILNADDPQIAYLGEDLKGKIIYFGLEQEKSSKKLQHASDSIYCPKCSKKLIFEKNYYSHLGIWYCNNCTFKRPKPLFSDFFYPMPGIYNKYNTLAAVTLAHVVGLNAQQIEVPLHTITPAFGRQEILEVKGKKIQIFLSKNPTSFNQSLQTIVEIGAKHVLFILNDRIPDGLDVSWIWDIDFEEYIQTFTDIIISGDRAWDMALRLEYSIQSQNSKLKTQIYKEKLKIYEDLEKAIQKGLHTTQENETLYILPTYTAMLEVRKTLTGKKIL